MKPKVPEKTAGAVRVHELWCKRCGICVAFCPREVFSQDSPQSPLVARLERCTVCRICEMRCPEDAASVEEVHGP